MKIHEYQAKTLFEQYEIPTTNGIIIEDKKEIEKKLKIVSYPCMVKAQVHSGARGKAGGIKFAADYETAVKYANLILEMKLKSSQNANEVKIVNKILIAPAVDIKKEYYLSLTLDRTQQNPVVIFSYEGGIDIEELAISSPEKIITKHIDIQNPIFNVTEIPEINDIIKKMYKLYVEKDCSLVEINPLVLTSDDKIVAIDAKINFDDNALFRHPEIVELKDEKEENELELEAQKYNLNYIKLDGTIGCMVNGAGLAMATMDIIKIAGKNPANFLDVGGGADAQKIEKAFEILVFDKDVKAVFINIFGGILRCDILAQGIKSAVENLKIEIPVIIRLEGTNKESGVRILKNSNLKFSVVSDLKEAIEKIKEL